MTDSLQVQPGPLVCPVWCKDSHTPPLPVLTDEMHSDYSVGFDVKDAKGRYVSILDMELGAFSRPDGTPGRPFIGLGDDVIMIYDLATIDAVIGDLEESLGKVREWREVLAEAATSCPCESLSPRPDL